MTPPDKSEPVRRLSMVSALVALAVRDIERASSTLGRVARSAVANYNAEMARINASSREQKP